MMIVWFLLEAVYRENPPASRRVNLDVHFEKEDGYLSTAEVYRLKAIFGRLYGERVTIAATEDGGILISPTK